MKHLKTATAISASLMLIACAKHPEDIQAQYTSPLQYQSYSCKQISQELTRVSRHVQEVGGTVKKTAESDDMEMGVGLILLWPTLFFLDGDTPQAAEYARLKGEFDALEKAAIQKDCGLKIERPVIKSSKPENSGEDFPSGGRRR